MDGNAVARVRMFFLLVPLLFACGDGGSGGVAPGGGVVSNRVVSDERRVGAEPGDSDLSQSALTSARNLTGTWSGSGTFYSNCANPACRYNGRVTLTLRHSGSKVTGTVRQVLTGGTNLISGWACNSSSGVSNIRNGRVSSSRFTFSDIANGRWSFTFTTDLMSGTLRNSTAGCGNSKSSSITLTRGGSATDSGGGSGGGSAAVNSSMTWWITDRCNDGQRMKYRFFDRSNDFIWPSSTRVYVAPRYRTTYESNLACASGYKVCVGGERDDGYYYWGVGLDGSDGCIGCCARCDGGTYSYSFRCS